MIPIPKTDLSTIRRENSRRILHIFEHESASPGTKRKALEKLVSLGDFETFALVVKNEGEMDASHPVVFFDVFKAHPETLLEKGIAESCAGFPALAFLIASSDSIFGAVPKETLETVASGCTVPGDDRILFEDELARVRRRSEMASGEILFRRIASEEAFLEMAVKIRARTGGKTVVSELHFSDNVFAAMRKFLEDGDAEGAAATARMLDALNGNGNETTLRRIADMESRIAAVMVAGETGDSCGPIL